MAPPITIVPYRPEWPSEFLAIARTLRSAFDDGDIAIHHIGSTAIPGLGAKDVIDIQLTVLRLDRVAASAVLAAGFDQKAPIEDHCPPGFVLPPEELAKRFYNCQRRPANLHVRERGRFNQRYAILCRDYLRTHKMAADAYGEIKQQLARYFPDSADDYYNIKDPVFDVIMAGALEWAEATSWSIPPSDA